MNPPRYVLEDPSLPHQIVLLYQSPGVLAVSCNCRSTGKGENGRKGASTGGHRAIAAKTKWESGEAYACWLGHMAAIGAIVA